MLGRIEIMRGVAGQVTTGRSVALTRAAAGVIVLLALFLSGCPVGPDFVKPDPTMPENYRSELEPAEAASFADLPFWDVFNDGTLRDLIQEALANNYDLKTAIYNVEAAQHQVGITRSPLFPAVNYQGGAQRSRVFIGPEFPNTTTNIFLGAFTLAWEIDLWGRIRRATESSKAQMLAAEDIRRGIVLSLVASVASQYFNLQELDLELQIAVSTTESFTETEALFTRRYLGGVDSKLSVERAKAALHETAATIPQALAARHPTAPIRRPHTRARPPVPSHRAPPTAAPTGCSSVRRRGCHRSSCCVGPTSSRPKRKSRPPMR